MNSFQNGRSRYRTIVLFLLLSVGLCQNAKAQITPDDTLGAERSTVRALDTQTDRIEGGAIRGSNLFHSFQDFNIDEGRAAYFGNPDGIETILSRVTGSNPSRLLGTLGVLGNADLFLLNPNGIVFGANARLDVRGSFVASTAHAIQFGEQGLFSATQPQAVPLLTVNPSALLFNQLVSQPVNQSTQAIATRANLSVPTGQSLLLVAGNAAATPTATGDILMEGGLLRAPGGVIELAAIASPASIGLDLNGSEYHLRVPENIQRADITLTNTADINARAGGGGSIAVFANNLDLLNSSRIRTGISTSGMASRDGGDININTTGTVNLTGGSFVSNSVLFGRGNSGNILIDTDSLLLSEGAFISSTLFTRGSAGDVTITADDLVSITGGAFASSNTFGFGDAGNLTVKANQINIVGFSRLTGLDSSLRTTVEPDAVGNGGNINLIAESVSLTNGALITTSTGGQGNAGDIFIDTSNRIIMDGVSEIGSTGIFSEVARSGGGSGGNIEIRTRSLTMTDGAVVVSGTLGIGDAGNILIRAHEAVVLYGGNSNEFTTGIFSGVGSVLRRAAGSGGNIKLVTRSLSLINGAQLSASTFADGNAGNIALRVENNTLINGSGSDGISSGIVSTVELGGEGNGGQIRLSTNSLSIRNGGLIATQTGAAGNAGDVMINARDHITFNGIGENGFRSGILADAISSSNGRAGEVQISTDRLNIQQGAAIAMNNQGSRRAGNLTLNARSVTLSDRGRITAETLSSRGGNINLQISESLRLSNRSRISASTQNGRGGQLRLNVNQNSTPLVLLSNRSRISTAATGRGDAGDITLNARQLLLQSDSTLSAANLRSTQQTADIRLQGLDTLAVENSRISASTRTGQGGSLRIDAADGSVALQGRLADQTPAGLSVEATGRSGRAGDLTIVADELTLTEGAIATVSSLRGRAGDLQVRSAAIDLEAGGLTAEAGVGSGANIELQQVELLRMQQNSQISARAIDTANGGNVAIAANDGFVVAFPYENSDIIANAELGNGGNIVITTQGLLGLELRDPLSRFSDINASSQAGVDGQIIINTPDVDPSRGLVNLPTETATPQIDQRCQPGGSATNRFVATGRGGLPTSPTTPLYEALWEDLRSPISQTSRLPAETRSPTIATEAGIVEAQGWIVDEQGRTTLVAQSPSVTPTHPYLSQITCQALNPAP